MKLNTKAQVIALVGVGSFRSAVSRCSPVFANGAHPGVFAD